MLLPRHPLFWSRVPVSFRLSLLRPAVVPVPAMSPFHLACAEYLLLGGHPRKRGIALRYDVRLLRAHVQWYVELESPTIAGSVALRLLERALVFPGVLVAIPPVLVVRPQRPPLSLDVSGRLF